MNSYKTSRGSGFTLTELMVVITIVSIISLATYLPYAHHQKKILIKQASREISQSISEARNMALHGLTTGSGNNLNVGLYFASGATSVEYYTSTGTLDITALPADVYKSKSFPRGIQIDDINGSSTGSLMSFSAIYGSGYLSNTAFTSDIDIQISYKGATTPVLQNTITYYTKSYISDY